MRESIFLIMVFSVNVLIQSCSKEVTRVKPEPTFSSLSEVGKRVTVQVRRENVRRQPNGKIIGRVKKGEELCILRRIGNWIEFESTKFKRAYIWAPSVGYSYLNLYNPFFYFDTLRQAFKPLSFFQKVFSQRGQRRQETGTGYELFFREIGLGSHQETVLEVVTESSQIVEHGITLYIDKSRRRITQVRVDFLRPVKGYMKALRRCELPVKKPVETNSGHLIWPERTLLPSLIVDLERKEWDSKWFSSIWYKLPDRK